MKIRTEKIIDINDWDELVSTTYGRPYSFQQQGDCQDRGMYWLTVPNHDDNYDEDNFDSIPEIINGKDTCVKFAKWLERDPKQILKDEKESVTDQWGIDLWWARNFYPCIEAVANDLHEKGLLEAGEYGINIDW